MKIFTAHMRDSRPPLLLREGFSWCALIFGPLWLALHRAWIPAALALAAAILFQLTPEPARFVLTGGLSLLLGFNGRDLLRWSAAHRGYLLTHVLAARDEAEAYGRLLHARPDLARRIAEAEVMP